MGDMGDFYRDAREHDRQRREKHFDTATEKAWPVAWEKHTPHHWSVMLQGARCDYWPSTNRLRWKGATRRMNADQVAVFVMRRATP